VEFQLVTYVAGTLNSVCIVLRLRVLTEQNVECGRVHSEKRYIN